MDLTARKGRATNTWKTKIAGEFNCCLICKQRVAGSNGAPTAYANSPYRQRTTNFKRTFAIRGAASLNGTLRSSSEHKVRGII
jgi:hypothetical protein